MDPGTEASTGALLLRVAAHRPPTTWKTERGCAASACSSQEEPQEEPQEDRSLRKS